MSTCLKTTIQPKGKVKMNLYKPCGLSLNNCILSKGFYVKAKTIGYFQVHGAPKWKALAERVLTKFT